MEIFSGLLLTLAVLAIVGFVARELIVGEEGASMKQYVGDSAPAELPMLGKRGTVMDVSGEFMRVRIEGERWRANPVDGTILPAGTPIRVIAVNGLVLDVEAAADEGSAANENDATNGDDATAEELAGDG